MSVGTFNEVCMKSVLEGMFHPKNQSFIITYSPSGCSKSVWISFFCWTQKILWRIWVPEQLLVLI